MRCAPSRSERCDCRSCASSSCCGVAVLLEVNEIRAFDHAVCCYYLCRCKFLFFLIISIPLGHTHSYNSSVYYPVSHFALFVVGKNYTYNLLMNICCWLCKSYVLPSKQPGICSLYAHIVSVSLLKSRQLQKPSLRETKPQQRCS